MKGFMKLVVIFAFLLKTCESHNNNNTFGVVRTLRIGPRPPWNETYVDQLRNDLLTNYDKYARPGQHYDVTTVRIGLFITYLETDELNSTVSVSSWLHLTWTDSKLKWNPQDYGGIKSVKMADHEVWKPDIYLYNSAAGGETVTRYGNPLAIVYSDGNVLWVPPSKFTALCEFDLHYWPFDTQHCVLKFASWTRSGKELQLELYNDEFGELELVIPVSVWNVNTTAEVITKFYDCCPDPFYTAQFNLTLTRKSSSYVAAVITPAFAITCLILIQCWLPSQSGQRIVLSCCTAVMISILLTYFTRKVAAMGATAPWIVYFYSTSLYLACFSVAESIFVLLLFRTKQMHSLPWNIRKYLKGNLGKLLLLEHCAPECRADGQNAQELRDYRLSEFEDKIDENDVIIKSPSVNLIQHEWEVIVVAVDRILFLTYCFVFFVLLVAYLV